MKRKSSAPLELKQLQYFVAVGEELSLSKAARRLNIAQPPLTRHIKFIEETVGAQLFIRTSKGVELTAAGQVLLTDAKALLEMAEQTFSKAKSAASGETGHLAIGGFGAQMLDAVPKFLRRFRKDHPNIQITLQTLNRPEQIEALREQRIDVAFNRQGTYPQDIESVLLSQEKLVAALPSSDPLVGRKKISLKQLNGRSLIVQGSGPRPNFTDALLSMCERAGFVVTDAQEVGDSLTAVALVAGGFGVALVSQSAMFLQLPGVVYVPLSDATPGIADIVCIYRPVNTSPVLQLLLKELRSNQDNRSQAYIDA